MSGWQIIRFEEVGSTNDVAKELSINPPSKKFVVTAKKQTAGRGRRGRAWQSLEGNLFLSQAFICEVAKLTEAVFVVSLSLFEAIQSFCPKGNLQLKWPNDVLLDNRKLSGILLEKGENEYIIAGIGINIMSAPKATENILYPATCLKDYGVIPEAEQLLEAYLQAFDKNESLWQSQGFLPIKDKWLSNLKGLNEQILVNLDKGQETGVFAGIADNGALVLCQQQGLKQILAGDIFYTEEKEN